MQEKPDTVKLVNGDLISLTFFEKMATEVNEMLHTGTPALGVTEIAQNFSLPVEYVRACLQEHIGSLIQGETADSSKRGCDTGTAVCGGGSRSSWSLQLRPAPPNLVNAGTLEGSTLYTPPFVRLAKAFLRGTLRAASSPVHVASVLSSEPFPHSDAVTSKLAASLVHELLAERAITGTFKTAGLIFCPDAYIRAQVCATQVSFQQNRALEYNMLCGWGIAHPKEFLKQHCPEGIPLGTVYVSRDIIDQVGHWRDGLVWSEVVS